MTKALEDVTVDNRADAARTAVEGHNQLRARVPQAGGRPTAQTIVLPALQGEMEGGAPKPASGAPVLKDWSPLHQIKARLQVCVGEATISVGELLGAKEHQVLCLERGIDQPVDLTIEGKLVARGHLMAVDGRFAVRITELPVALGLSPGSGS